jgi:hypothetical protein
MHQRKNHQIKRQTKLVTTTGKQHRCGPFLNRATVGSSEFTSRSLAVRHGFTTVQKVVATKVSGSVQNSRWWGAPIPFPFPLSTSVPHQSLLVISRPLCVQLSSGPAEVFFCIVVEDSVNFSKCGRFPGPSLRSGTRSKVSAFGRNLPLGSRSFFGFSPKAI